MRWEQDLRDRSTPRLIELVLTNDGMTEQTHAEAGGLEPPSPIKDAGFRNQCINHSATPP